MTEETQVQYTLRLCRGDGGRYDPLHGDTPEDLERVHGDEARGFVYLEGTAEAETSPTGGEYAEDLLIVCHDSGWALFWRDPTDAPKSLWWGRDWHGGRVHSTWDSLVGEAYSL